ncbi:HD domain-containing protein [bacterium]|nr:HD domain-containing protein [bacterium]
MKPFFSQDLYLKTWNFSSKAHIGQTLPGSDLSYLNHIGNVTMEVIAAISAIPVENPDLSIQCALLHDVIEDTDVTYDQVKTEFGEKVASGVRALTKNKSLPTKQEQMQDSLNRIANEPREIWIVKLADRITNLQPPPPHWKLKKIETYRKEAILIHEHLGKAHVILSERLNQKIKAYQSFIQ